MAHKENPKAPRTTFILYLPIKFSISSSKKTYKEFMKILKEQGKDVSKVFRKFILNNLMCKNEQEILSKHKQINSNLKQVKRSIEDELGIYPGDWSQWCNTFMEEYIQEHGKKSVINNK